MITKLELIEYLKHTPENTNYNILYSSLYNGSNKEAVDEFIEVLSRGNLSLAALQPYLAKLYEDDKTISPEPLPPFSIGGSPDAVLYTEQTLTEVQKRQARNNIDASIDGFEVIVSFYSDGTIKANKTFAQIKAAIQEGRQPAIKAMAGGGSIFMPMVMYSDTNIVFSSESFPGNRATSFNSIQFESTGAIRFVETSMPAFDNDGHLPQFIMASDPIDSMQIATKKYVDDHATGGTGGGSPNAVLYTAQTLTDAQKKQARENIDAAIAEFMINVTLNSDGPVTLDKTFEQIQAAIQEGKKPAVKLSASGMGDTFMPLVTAATDMVVFAAVGDVSEGTISSIGMVITAEGVMFDHITSPTLTSDGALNQYSMESDPISPMQIATKKYVDDALDGKAGTAVATTSANGLMSKDDKAKLDGITGQMTAANIHAPEHTTDLVQYGAFQIAAQQIISQIPTVPTALKNPNALTIKIGSTTVTYDGSTAQTVTIDDGTEVSY